MDEAVKQFYRAGGDQLGLTNCPTGAGRRHSDCGFGTLAATFARALRQRRGAAPGRV
ncbi:MAG: hypothetical protein WKG07_22835 [Hymenobacter sp.]